MMTPSSIYWRSDGDVLQRQIDDLRIKMINRPSP